MASYRITTAIDAREDLKQITSEYKLASEALDKRFLKQFRVARNSLQANPQCFQEVFYSCAGPSQPTFPTSSSYLRQRFKLKSLEFFIKSATDGF